MHAQLQKQYEEFKGFELKDLIRESDLGSSLSFVDARPAIMGIKDLFDQIFKAPLKSMPYKQLEQISSQLNDAINHFGNLRGFNALQQNPANARNALVSETENKYQNYFTNLSPVLVYGLTSGGGMSVQQAKIEDLLMELQNAVVGYKEEGSNYLEEIRDLATSARSAASDIGVSKHSSVFQTEADKFETQSNWWLGWQIALMFVIAIVAGMFLLYIPDGERTTAQIVQYTLSKVVILSVLFYGLSVCSRNYRAFKHNALVNRHRQNALTTFETFSSAAGPDEQTKNAVLLEATHSIFGGQRTGYLVAESESDSPSKVIEIFKGITGNSD